MELAEESVPDDLLLVDHLVDGLHIINGLTVGILVLDALVKGLQIDLLLLSCRESDLSVLRHYTLRLHQLERMHFEFAHPLYFRS